jgi:hypothetical protein
VPRAAVRSLRHGRRHRHARGRALAASGVRQLRRDRRFVRELLVAIVRDPAFIERRK